MCQSVHDRNGRRLAMLGFSAAAWRLALRDAFIGWTPGRRERNLPLVTPGPRFLPWTAIPDLGSRVLSLARRRLPGDWTAARAPRP